MREVKRQLYRLKLVSVCKCLCKALTWWLLHVRCLSNLNYFMDLSLLCRVNCCALRVMDWFGKVMNIKKKNFRGWWREVCLVFRTKCFCPPKGDLLQSFLFQCEGVWRWDLCKVNKVKGGHGGGTFKSHWCHPAMSMLRGLGSAQSLALFMTEVAAC